MRVNIYRIVPFMLIMVNIIVHYNYSLYIKYSPLVAYANLGMYVWLFIVNRKVKLNLRELIWVGLAFIYASFISATNGNSVGALVAYLELYLVCFTLSHFSFTKTETKIMFISCMLISLKHALMANNLFVIWTADPERYLNPNTVGMFMFFAFTMFCIANIDYVFRVKKVLFFVWIFLIYQEYLLRCRTYMITSFILGVCIMFIPMSIWQNKKIVKIFWVAIGLAGCIFPYVYTILSTNEQLSILVHDYTGKYLFTGREYTWINFFNYELSHKRDFLFGAGSWIERSFSDKFSLHNSYLGIIMNFGIVGLVLYIYYLLIVVDIVYSRAVSHKQIIMLLGFMGFMIASCTEVVLQTPMSALLVGILLAQARNNDSSGFMMSRFWDRAV